MGELKKVGDLENMAITVKCPVYPQYTINIATYTNVKNCDEVKKMIVGNEVEATALNPRMIADLVQVFAAASKSIHSHVNNNKATKTLHSEVIYSLAPSRNISDSFRRFGMDVNDSCVMIVEISDGPSRMDEIQSRIKGDMTTDVSSLADEPRIKKVYKIKEDESKVGTLVDAILCRMACKEFVNFK